MAYLLHSSKTNYKIIAKIWVFPSFWKLTLWKARRISCYAAPSLLRQCQPPTSSEDQTLASWFDLRQGTLAYLWLGVLAWTGSKVLVALSPPWEPDPPQIPSNCSIPLLESFFWQQLLIFAPSATLGKSRTFTLFNSKSWHRWASVEQCPVF